MRSRASVAGALGVALLAAAAVGCGMSPPAPASPTGPPPLPRPSQAPTSTAAHVGAGCGVIPMRGPGSFRSMSGLRAAAATSSDPQLSVFSSAIKAAALRDELNRMRSFTLFVPVNSAFAALSGTDVSYLRNPANLVRVIRRHVAPAEVTPARIARGGSVVTLSGSKLVLAKRGRAYQVDEATVLCGNIKTANGTLYVIDRVLLPK